jgi:phosphonate transport system ATP-binding protein
VIELFGVGAKRQDGGWLLHRVCARFHDGEIIVVVSRRPEERLALLDALTARIVPEEGRVWVSRHPVARETVRRIRALVADVDLHACPVGQRSLLWNVLTGRPGYAALSGLLRLPRKSERQSAHRALERVGLGGRPTESAGGLGAMDRARLALAVALAQRPEIIVVREVDAGFDPTEAETVRGLLRSVASSDGVALVVSAGAPAFACGFADRLVAIAHGRLIFEGSPADFDDDTVARRFGTA